MGRYSGKLMQATIRNRDLWFYIIFLVICGFLAAARDSAGDYLAVILHPIMLPVLLGIVLLAVCAWRGANTRIALVVLCMLTLAALMRVVIWNAYPGAYDEGEKLTTNDYFFTIIVILVVAVIYAVRSPFKGLKFYELLSSKKFTFLLFVLIAILHLALIFFGVEENGSRQWINLLGHYVQLTEIIKFLFVICLAAMMNRDEKPILAMFFWFINVALMALLYSEFGAALVMTVVFFIFIAIFPQKVNVYTIISVVLLIVLSLAGLCVFLGKKEYDYSLRQSDSRVFAAAMANPLYEYAMSTDETVVTMDILKEMVSNAALAMEGEDKAALKREFLAIEKQIEDRDLALSDFDFTGSEPWTIEPYKSVYGIIKDKTENAIGEETGKALDAAIRQYPAVRVLSILCQDPGFREAYIHRFCSSTIYDNSDTLSLTTPAAGKFSHKASRGIPMLSYRKIVERVVLWNEGLRGLFGFQETEKKVSDQVGRAQAAMRIGGLRGAEKHEFMDVYVMESDMIYSEMVSLYGFGMGFFVILLYMIFFREGIREVVKLEGKPFHKGLALGITLMIFAQALIIIAGNLNVFPLTGIPLPFIADGFMAMLVFGALVGLLLAVSYVPIVEAQVETESTREQMKKPVRFVGRLIQSVSGLVWSIKGRGKDGFKEDLLEGKDAAIAKGKGLVNKARKEVEDIIHEEEEEIKEDLPEDLRTKTKQKERKTAGTEEKPKQAPAGGEESGETGKTGFEKKKNNPDQKKNTKYDWNK